MHHHRRDDARQDELLRRVGAERADGVDLLGHVHRAHLGGHPAADAPPDDDGGERRRELAREREDDDARDVLEPAEAAQAERELDGHDHPDEERGHGDDAQRPDPERIDLVQDGDPLERPLERGPERLAA